jgi:hypothetical protein
MGYVEKLPSTPGGPRRAKMKGEKHPKTDV